MKTLLSKLAVAVVAVVLLVFATVPSKAQTGGNNYTTYRSSIMSTGTMTSATASTNTFAVGNSDKPQVMLLPRGPNNWGFLVDSLQVGSASTVSNILIRIFQCSRDGTNWVTTPSASGLTLYPPGILLHNVQMNGTTVVQAATNFPAASFAGFRYVRLYGDWNTNSTGNIFTTNVYGAAFSTPNP